jgi:energy-coupling factor transporter ATP-binding protein EcfA2
MTLEEEIVAWSEGRPAWQRAVLGRLARGEAIGPPAYKEIAARLASSQGEAAPPFAASDLKGGGRAHKGVRVLSVAAIAHVNALVGDQSLTFEPQGLTVVYGDNASGKSGYARLIKAIVRARHHEPVLTNIFTDTGADHPEAIVRFESDGVALEATWPGEAATPLTQICFYDEECGDAYVSTESELTYRPSALALLDGLIRACDAVRVALESALTTNQLARIQFPDVPPGTAAARFLSTLSGDTTAAELDVACGLPKDANEEIARLIQEEARIRTTDPDKERMRLSDRASRLEALAGHVVKLEATLGSAGEERLRDSQRRANELRAAADMASAMSFDTEPVAGVGTETWRALWSAARRYSEAAAYPTLLFPYVGDDAHCVLCHQDLTSPAAGRLTRFEAFMTDSTQAGAANAEKEWRDLLLEKETLNVLPTEIAVTLESRGDEHGDVLIAAAETVSAFARRRQAILAWAVVPGPQDIAVPAPTFTPTDALRSAAAQSRAQAAAIDSSSFTSMLSDVRSKRDDLIGRRALLSVRAGVLTEVDRRRVRGQLEAAKRSTDTTGITRKSTELVREHVTALVRDRFTRESDRLKLERVTLQDVGGQKGQLRHRPAFLGAAQSADMARVLSQGEQTALGLAGYYTEAFFDSTQSSLVLDDPVDSMDHIRRSLVARRLAEFAADRQVIVFTHEITFVGDLRRAADHEGVRFTERSVERRGDGSPGVCLDQHPWKARDTRERLGKLAEGLARIKRDRTAWDQDVYEKETADWAGMLSETWERLINIEVVNQVVDRGTSEVRPKKFRLLARITEADDREFQESYGRCSFWARRHDKSPEINYMAPQISEMEQELHLVKSWFDRIRKYAD